MANRFPLVVDSSTSTLKEIPSADNLDLTGISRYTITYISKSNTTTQ